MPLTGEQKREYQRKWIKQRRDKWIESQGGCCALCGSTDRLEIDHVYPKLKAISVARIWSWSEERRNKELEKCQVLCYDCHLKKTVEAVPEPEHGTVGRYYSKKHRCRCEDCKRAGTVDRRRYPRS